MKALPGDSICGGSVCVTQYIIMFVSCFYGRYEFVCLGERLDVQTGGVSQWDAADGQTDGRMDGQTDI